MREHVLEHEKLELDDSAESFDDATLGPMLESPSRDLKRPPIRSLSEGKWGVQGKVNQPLEDSRIPAIEANQFNNENRAESVLSKEVEALRKIAVDWQEHKKHMQEKDVEIERLRIQGARFRRQAKDNKRLIENNKKLQQNIRTLTAENEKLKVAREECRELAIDSIRQREEMRRRMDGENRNTQETDSSLDYVQVSQAIIGILLAAVAVVNLVLQAMSGEWPSLGDFAKELGGVYRAF